MPTNTTIHPKTRISRIAKVERVYTFFDDCERSGQRFSLQEICRNSGYSRRTAKSYITKKWYWFLRVDPTTEQYYCDGLHQYPKAQFIASHRQKWEPFVSHFRLPENDDKIPSETDIAHKERMNPMSLFSGKNAKIEGLLEQIHTEVTEKVVSSERRIIAAIQQFSPPDFSQIQAEIQVLREEIQQLHIQSELVQVKGQLEQILLLMSHFSSASEIEQLKKKVDGLSSTVEKVQKVERGIPLSSVLPVSEQRTLDVQMDKHIRETLEGIIGNMNILGQDLAQWIDQHYFAVHRDQLALREDVLSHIDQRFAHQLAQIPQTYRIQEHTDVLPEKDIRLIEGKSEIDTTEQT